MAKCLSCGGELGEDALFCGQCGTMVEAEQEWRDAKAHFDKGEAFFNQAVNSLFNKKSYDNAITEYTEAIKFNPRDAVVFSKRGEAYCNSKKYDLAIADYTEAIKLDPNNANYYNWRGITYYKKKDHDSAIADFSQAKRLDPSI
jgi:tetratricopeptide (TPR) repeat protein